MNYRRLGRSGLVVSDVCMGTMTFGLQTSEKEAFRIMDRSVEAGIDFFDVAEVYPVPPSKETVGITEEIVGRWMKSKDRDSLIIATKVTGPGHGWFVPPVRSGKTSLDRRQITKALEDSLTRLQTDYVDLYQMHWPDHGMRHEDTLEVLTDLIDEGKIRVIGSSNETSWGLMKSLWTSEKHELASYDTVQNNFSIINRRCENELAQVCRKEGVSLLPYSPIGGGVLSGKYNGGKTPAGARFSDYLVNGQDRQKAMAVRFVNDRTCETAERVRKVADGLGISPVTLAVAWSKQHDFVASTIVGVSEESQLDEIFATNDFELDAETLEAIDLIDREIPNPMTEDGLRRL